MTFDRGRGQKLLFGGSRQLAVMLCLWYYFGKTGVCVRVCVRNGHKPQLQRHQIISDLRGRSTEHKRKTHISYCASPTSGTGFLEGVVGKKKLSRTVSWAEKGEPGTQARVEVGF